MATGTDVLQELTDEHRRLRALFKELMEAAPGDQARKRLLDGPTVELVRHLVAEENYLHPAVRRCLTDGDRIIEDGRSANAELENLLRELEGRKADAPDFDQLLTVLHNETVAHIEDAHHIMFTQLRQHCPRSTREELGDAMRRAAESAGTRTPAGLGPGPGLVDRARGSLHGG